MRAPEPPTLLWTTIRMVWLSKDGPPVVMLGDQALTLVAFPCGAEVAALARWEVLNGTTVSAMPVSAAHTDGSGRRNAVGLPFAEDIVVLSAHVVVSGDWGRTGLSRSCSA
ncbi:hypothetical protein GCM10010276_08330 [Streptomyces longisporus]|uniref:Uncharacterized protein n=1 Tax=Streptomyces longisporus TaxID=1948 RepID=A0ABN3L366_STRLO